MWRPLLKPGGCVVASEATWLTDDPPDEARQLFQGELPDMTNVEGNVSRAAGAGYDVLDHFVLPASAWWNEYYTPMQKRIEVLRPQVATDADLAAVIGESEHEIDVFRRFGRSYSYVFYIMQKRA
jgi:serine/threonine-protein kinase HipA